MVPSSESSTTTDAISGFVRAIRSSTVLSERQLEKIDANPGRWGASHRTAGRTGLTPGQGRDADRVPGEADPQG